MVVDLVAAAPGRRTERPGTPRRVDPERDRARPCELCRGGDPSAMLRAQGADGVARRRVGEADELAARRRPPSPQLDQARICSICSAQRASRSVSFDGEPPGLVQDDAAARRTPMPTSAATSIARCDIRVASPASASALVAAFVTDWRSLRAAVPRRSIPAGGSVGWSAAADEASQRRIAGQRRLGRQWHSGGTGVGHGLCEARDAAPGLGPVGGERARLARRARAPRQGGDSSPAGSSRGAPSPRPGRSRRRCRPIGGVGAVRSLSLCSVRIRAARTPAVASAPTARGDSENMKMERSTGARAGVADRAVERGNPTASLSCRGFGPSGHHPDSGSSARID